MITLTFFKPKFIFKYDFQLDLVIMRTTDTHKKKVKENNKNKNKRKGKIIINGTNQFKPNNCQIKCSFQVNRLLIKLKNKQKQMKMKKKKKSFKQHRNKYIY